MRLLKLVPDNTNIGFVRLRWWAFGLTIALTVASLGLFATRGLNLGVDFVGGLLMEVGFEQTAPLDDLRSTLLKQQVGDVSIQEFGGPKVVALRLPLPPGDAAAVQRVVTRVEGAIKARHPDASFRRVETVSGKVSAELIRTGITAVALGMLGIALFTWLRFEWHFGVSTLVALVHDVIVTLGFFALMQWEFNLNVVAAILTIIGYSLNDKIVIDDRIRENLRKYRKMGIGQLIDLSVNETLPRTVNTSLSLILALGAFLVLGGEVLRGFTAAMLIGIIVGTYSSVFVSSSLLISLGLSAASFGPGDKAAERLARP
jgi:preprotein translocase subunit SecF